MAQRKSRLKKALQDIEDKDKFIPALETQIIEMDNEISLLQHKIQKLREGMTLDLLHLPATNTLVFDLITDVRTNIKLLADSARGDNDLLINEINNYQTQIEAKLTQIQDGCYTFENDVTQLRQEVENLSDINRNQQELGNELGILNETLKEQLNNLTDRNETIQTKLNEKTRIYELAQDRLDECREECYQIRESLQGAHEDITESELVYDELKRKLRILRLTHIAWQARNLRQAQILDIEFNTARNAWRNQRDRNQRITRELQNCRRHGRNLQNDKNNPLPNPNMAAIEHVMQTISPRLAILPDYDGQEPPHTYFAKLRAINETARPLDVVAFNDAEKANVMKSKMTGRFFPVPPRNPYNANANIVTEAEVYNWMEGKYRETMIGNQRASLKALMNEKFTSLDTIDTYEKRIRPYVLGIVDAEVLPYLYDHLPPRLETRIRIANPDTVNNFFTQLRIIWLESGGPTGNFRNVNEINNGASAMVHNVSINQFSQKNVALEKFGDIAIRLGYSGDLSDPIASDETRIRIANPDTVNNFFTQLRIIWLESGGPTGNFRNVNEINNGASAMVHNVSINQFSQKNVALEKFGDIAIRLGYSGDLSDPIASDALILNQFYPKVQLLSQPSYQLNLPPLPIAIHKYTENNLTKRLGTQSNHIKKEPFGQVNEASTVIRKVYTTKKPQKSQKPQKVTYKCSNCGKLGHRKNKCPGLVKKPKKVNNVYQNDPENSDDEEVLILEDDEDENEEEEEEVTSDDNDNTQHCFNTKKKDGFL
ncbi:hypothetical protein Glove_329g35 [Diversispora epigaea]|uniref:CCHC-type domain-containing protein n=1 Tax=Diversispora epigaea TaxID=1348612 RepID=A0A397HKA5_9GLOM|nr:hypothetical protein Glove_329g35 [Diversispora epigaea]